MCVRYNMNKQCPQISFQRGVRSYVDRHGYAGVK